jgi:hypothetical protein
VAAAVRIFDFFGLEADPALAEELMQRPPSSGRWRSAHPELAAEVMYAGVGALRRFGHI